MKNSGVMRRILFSGLMVFMIMALLLGTVGIVFALATLTWTAKAPMGTDRMAPGVVAASNGKIYAIGGAIDAWGYKTVEAYNPVSNSWEYKADMTYPRASLGCTQAGNGKIYAIGGYYGAVMAYNEEYDPVLNTWTTKSPLPVGRHNPTVVAANSKVYAIGGTTISDGYTGVKRVDIYDPSGNTWATGADMPTARWAAAGVLADDGNIYVIGGRGAAPPYAFNTVEAYNPLTNTWTTKANMPTARSSLAAAAAGDGKIYAIGGYNNGADLATVEAYDPAANTWSSETPILTPNYTLGGAYINGNIYAVGGYTGTATNAVESASIPLSTAKSITTATGTGTATFTTSNGSITGLMAMAQSALACTGNPGASFPHGFFSFTITGIPTGSTVTITITLPSNMPAGTQYWKCINGNWVDCTSLLGDNDGDNILTLTIRDGGLGDSISTPDGMIVDPGGPGVPGGGGTAENAAEGAATGESSSTTIRTANLRIAMLNVPGQARVNQPITISANVVNGGSETGSTQVALKINGKIEQTKLVTVGGGSSRPVKFTVTKAEPGSYTVIMGSQRASFLVTGDGAKAAPALSEGVIAMLLLAVVVVAFVIILAFAFRKKPTY